MQFNPEKAEIRFGCGLSPRYAPATSVADMLARLSGPDIAAQTFEIPTLTDILPQFRQAKLANRARRKAETQAGRKAAKKEYRQTIRRMRSDASRAFGHTLVRRIQGQDGLRERLTAFWADHFTARGKGRLWTYAYPNYVEEAIRPHVAGRFSDMLRAVATHPLMLQYLDQDGSVGPNSKVGVKFKGKRGLNENLAREMLELHTLGIGAPYTQTDVRQLAELLTGLSFSLTRGFTFLAGQAEPGVKTILGVSYGGETARLSDIFDALDALAHHPATARHIATKLATHFVSDTPDRGLIDALAATFLDTGGDLIATCDTLLNHPQSWSYDASNVKQPLDFMTSAMRALDLDPRHIPLGDPRKMQDIFLTPLALMGQPWGQAPAPDGWPEDDPSWITPQRLAARLQWAMSAPFLIRRKLPRPEKYLDRALGQSVPEVLEFAAKAAESRPEGIGIILASPTFQRF